MERKIQLPLFNSTEISRELRSRIVVRVREFSSMCILKYAEMSLKNIEYDISDDYFHDSYAVYVYPNGRDKSSEGSLSVEFREMWHDGERQVELVCLISVIDAEDNRRFSQSFVICHEFFRSDTDWSHFIDDYISHGVLLNESPDLLPDDVLTLHMDVVCKETSFISNIANEFSVPLCHSPFEIREGPGGSQEMYLFLDSDLAKHLHKKSSYFERLSVTPMKEKSSRWVKIPPGERKLLFKTLQFLLRKGPISFDSVEGIFDLYVLSDKYDIPTLTDACRSWLKMCLDSENASEISEFADERNDDCLRETVQAFLDKEHQQEVTEDYSGDPQRQAGSVKDEYILKKGVFDTRNDSLIYWFFNRGQIYKNEEEDYDFYS